MSLALLAGIVRARAELRSHDRWSHDELLARPDLPISTAEVGVGVTTALARVGVHNVPVAVDVVDEIPRTRLSKAPLIRRERT